MTRGCCRYRSICLLALLSSFEDCIVIAVKSRVTWINGIGHTLQHMEAGQAFISARFGDQKVEWCHNPTAMAHDEDWKGYLGDLTQATTQKMGMVTAEVKTLTQHLRETIKQVGRRGIVVHIAHSQGALITALACKHLTPQEMNRMEVICFGGAACLMRSAVTPFRRCMNYYAINDPLLLLNPEALQALRSGLVENEFCFLSPRLGDPVLDHALMNPTYAQALQWEGARYINLYLPITIRFWRCIVRLLRHLRVFIEMRLILALKKILRPAADWVLVRSSIARDRFLEPVYLVLLLFVEWIYSLVRKDEKQYVSAASAMTALPL